NLDAIRVQQKIELFHQGLHELLDFMLFFFAFIMLIEPVTTPSAKKGQIIFGAATAMLSAAFAMYTRIDFFLVSLLIMNIFTYRLNRIR
ncbi:MAG: RnfABCDGE type electron transport complex subunit D, partial [Candidatus Aenigmarchaeota archaeon]|nr:RnfABCDGE type electron transport complex subunit D [Candidatus Aenigmarchaeota archaeon]